MLVGSAHAATSPALPDVPAPMLALAFTLSRQSPHHTGELEPDEYRRIFSQAHGIYGTTLDYAQATHDELQRLGIDDKALKRLLSYADTSPFQIRTAI